VILNSAANKLPGYFGPESVIQLHSSRSVREIGRGYSCSSFSGLASYPYAAGRRISMLDLVFLHSQLARNQVNAFRFMD